MSADRPPQTLTVTFASGAAVGGGELSATDAIKRLQGDAPLDDFTVVFDKDEKCLQSSKQVLSAIRERYNTTAVYALDSGGDCDGDDLDAHQVVVNKMFDDSLKKEEEIVKRLPLSQLKLKPKHNAKSILNCNAQLFMWHSVHGCGFAARKPIWINSKHEIEEGSTTFLCLQQQFPNTFAEIQVPCIEKDLGMHDNWFYSKRDIEQSVKNAWTELVEANKGKHYSKTGKIVRPPKHKRAKYEAYMPSKRAVRKLLARDLQSDRMSSTLHRYVGECIDEMRSEAQERLRTQGSSTPSDSGGGHVYAAGEQPSYMSGKIEVDPAQATTSFASWDQVDPSSEVVMAASTNSFRAFLWATESTGSPAAVLKIRAHNFDVCCNVCA